MLLPKVVVSSLFISNSKMIKFFRKIRYNLLSENKTGKYLRYALGEILLVMIGILLALQVNNWNENRKDRKLEKELLSTLQNTLQQNKDLITSRMRSIAGYQRSGELFIDVIENKRPFHDSLKFYFHYALMNTSQIDISRLGYESIKNVGVEIIQNDTLKKEIITFFEDYQPGFLGSLNWGNIDAEDRERFLTENFKQGFDSNSKRVIQDPFEPNAILQNNYFKGLIYKIQSQRNYFIDVMKEHLRDNNELLEKLKIVNR